MALQVLAVPFKNLSDLERLRISAAYFLHFETSIHEILTLFAISLQLQRVVVLVFFG